MSSSHIGNKKEDTLVIVKGPTQELEHFNSRKNVLKLILLWQKVNFV